MQGENATLLEPKNLGKRKVSIPLSAEVQAQAEEITKDFNDVFNSRT